MQSAPVVAPVIQVRKKELEQSHIVFGTEALPQHHPDRYAGYALNTTLGGSMSSRLFQNVREKRGLAYSVFSGLSAYQDAGALSIYAGCANEAVAELIDVVVAEIRQMKAGGLDPVELRRAKDHLKGSLMLGLESTSSRMSHLARQEMYRDHTFGLDEMLAAIEKVTEADVLKLADRFFTNGSLAVTVLGNVNGLQVTQGATSALIPRYTNPEMGRIWSEQRRYETWLQVEIAAAEAMAAAGIVPGRSGARVARQGRVQHRAHRRNRKNHAARRDCVHDIGGRDRRAVGPVAALRPDLVGRRRHRAGAADGRSLRPHPQEHGGARRGRSRRAPRSTSTRR